MKLETRPIPTPPTSSSEAVVFDGPVATRIYQLIAAKHAIKLEKLGMKHSSGKSVRKHYALLLGLKPNAKHNDVILAIEARILELRAGLPEGKIQIIHVTGKEGGA
jgi:hypothetical protein